MNFVDTGGWYAFFVPSDEDHSIAVAWMASNRERLVTTDYVIDETLTLMRARGENAKAIRFGKLIFSGRSAAIHYLNPAEIAAAWDVFHRFADKEWGKHHLSC